MKHIQIAQWSKNMGNSWMGNFLFAVDRKTYYTTNRSSQQHYNSGYLFDTLQGSMLSGRLTIIME